MFPLPSSSGIPSYLRRVPSAVELNERIDDVHQESIYSTRSSQGPELDKDQILLEADEFVTEYHLEEIRDVIKNGALLYYDPEDPTAIGSLTQEEHLILYQSTKEESGAFKTVMKSTSSYINIAGSMLYVCLLQFSMESFKEAYSHHSIWLKSTPWIGSALLGCMFTVPLNRALGRRKAICVAAFLALVAACGKIFLRSNYLSLLTVNLLAGTSMGILGCTAPLYLAETSVSSSRGFTIATWNILMMLFEATINSGRMIVSIKESPFSTNLDFGVLMIVPSASIIMARVFANAVPESPYWCVSKGRMQEAFQSLCFFRKVKVIAARDLWQIYLADMHGMHRDSSQYTSSASQLTVLVANPRLRRAIVATAAIILSRNLSAFQVAQANLYHYAMGEVNRFLHDPSSVRTIVLLYIGVFIAYVKFASVAVCGRWIDSIGRRPFLMGLTLIMFLLTQVPGIEPAQYQALYWRICSVVALCFYIVFYGTTDMFHTVYTAEVFPTQYNDICMAIVMSVNHGSLAMIEFGSFYRRRTKLFPSQRGLSFSLFVSFLLVWLVMRETKKVTLEDIGRIFDMPTRNLILYRVNVHLPYIFKRYILFKDVDLTPLQDSRYRFAAITLDDTEALSAGASREGESD